MVTDNSVAHIHIVVPTTSDRGNLMKYKKHAFVGGTMIVLGMIMAIEIPGEAKTVTAVYLVGLTIVTALMFILFRLEQMLELMEKRAVAPHYSSSDERSVD